MLGASEAAAVLGLDRYRSPMDIWERKMAARAGEAPAVEEMHEAAFWGTALESVVRGKYALDTRTAVAVPTSSFVWQGHRAGDGQEWLRATPDGVVFELEGMDYVRVSKRMFGATHEWDDTWQDQLELHNSGGVGLLQVKTCSAYKADEWADGPPPAYEVQCRVEMAVMDLPWCDLVCLVGGQRYVGPYRIHRDVEIESNILRDLQAFWQHVVDGVPPDVDGSAAWLRHASSHMRPTKVAIAADADARAYMVELKQAKAELERAEAQAKELKTQLLLKLGAAGATVMLDPDLGKVSAYQVGGRMDYKSYAQALEVAFRTNLPASVDDVIQRKESYKSKGGTWALRTSWEDE